MLNTAIEQTTDTTGTGSYALVASANSLFRSYVQAIGSGASVWYRAELGSAWEEGWGVVTAGTPDTLTRNVTASSNGNGLVNWPSGTKRIFCTLLADGARFGAAGQLPTSAGTANAQTITHAPPCRVLRPGMVLRFIAGGTNTGAATLNVDGLGALPMQRANGAALTGGEVVTGAVVEAVVNAAGNALLLPNIANAATARAATETPLIPTAARWFRQFYGSGANVVLPNSAAETFAWILLERNTSTNALTAIDTGVNVGGTSIKPGATGFSNDALLWRIA